MTQNILSGLNDYKDRSNKAKDMQWKKSETRKWLNSDFYNISFSKLEKDMIILSRNKVSDGDIWRNNVTWENTDDNVFLLSEEEVLEYIPIQKERRVEHIVKDEVIDKPWLLRTPNKDGLYGTIVDSAGNITIASLTGTIGGIRPAIWLKADK